MAKTKRPKPPTRKPGQSKGGRVTAKSTGRYTPPIPKEYKESPLWVPTLMFTCLGLGMVIIVCNYLDVLPKGTNNWYLVAGLGLITAGFITATRYR